MFQDFCPGQISGREKNQSLNLFAMQDKKLRRTEKNKKILKSLVYLVAKQKNLFKHSNITYTSTSYNSRINTIPV